MSLVSFSTFANTPWSQLEGCYITREVNGKRLKLVPYWNDGSQSFKKDKAFAVLGKDKKELDTYSFYMYVEGIGLDTDVLPLEIFINQGSAKLADNTFSHNYKGRLPYKLKNGLYLNYDHQSEWKKISPSELEVNGHLKFDVHNGKRKVDYEYKAKLEKVYCSRSKAQKTRMNILQPLQQ